MNINPITVTELNLYIKNKLAEDERLNNIYIKGEISNFKHHYTGHMYFTLKDETGVVKCIMFKGSNEKLKFVPKDGMKVLILGTVAVYERDGVYQIYCKAMEEYGIGDLYKKYEELKNRLEKEGYFDVKHKKKIPFMPKIIGVLTSQTGSVIRDIINVSTRRNPNVYLRIFPVPVQGAGAGIEIAKAIELMNKNNLADVIILARGGGSLEDLWPFNEEMVAHAIYESNIPIISAVGHETDFTISDFVSDLRAPTPSAAAELAVADVAEIEEKISNYKKRCKISLHRIIEVKKLKLQKCMNSRVFVEPLQRINEEYIKIDAKVKQMDNSVKHMLKDCKSKAMNLYVKLDTISPLKTLTRGYSLVESNDKIVRSVKELKAGDVVGLRLADGKVSARVV